MKKAVKRMLSVALSLIMLLSAVPLAGLGIGIEAEAKSLSDCAVGEIITFGSYPQSLVKDSSLKSSLDSVSKTWISYGYYSGTGSAGTMYKDSWMKYADVSYGGNKYRAVTFSQYRPAWTCDPCSSGNSYQDNNGYITNTVYYFKYEPLKWRVLDPEEGLVMCESIIDSQAYSDTIYYKSGAGSQYGYFNDAEMTTYANDYATSSIREWLNDDFYNTAFTSSEKAEIGTTTLDNSCWSSSYPEFDSATTNDKIFLLSYDEVRNTEYGFSSSTGYDEAREAQGTDYAKCQGLWVSTSSSYYGNSYWRLRSPGHGSDYACGVYYGGIVSYYYSVGGTDIGIRPALKFNPKSEIFESFYTQEHTVSDYASKNAKYESEYFGGEAAALDGTKNTPDMVIPGLKNGENMVPQGVAYYAKKNWLLVSSYYNDGKTDSYPCMIFALDFSTGELVAEYKLMDADSSTFTGHVGGIAVSDYNLYITDGSGISYVPLSQLDSQSGSLTVVGTKNMSSYLGSAKPAYLSIDDGMLITGNFFYAKNSKYDTPAKAANSVILAQNLSGNSSVNEWNNFCNQSPFATVKVPDSVDRIQGAVYRNDKFYLSSSFGRTNTSTLYIADIDNSSGYSLKNIKSYKGLPMMEDMEFIGDYIYTAFESASAFYHKGLDGEKVSKHPTDVIWQIDYKALIGEKRTGTTTGDVIAEKVSYGENGYTTINFRQNYFENDSAVYNHSLAQLCSQFVTLGYDYSSLEKALKALGMDKIQMEAVADEDKVDYFIANRKVNVNGEEYTLIFTGLIGTNTVQWYSNFKPGTGATHQSFNSAKNYVYGKLTTYINSLNLDKSKTKILVTGHSRGAATANLVSAQLIKDQSFATMNNIYTYCFATPNSTTLSERKEARFNRIFNIVNPEDFVTKCLPSAWGYGRYGITYTLPSKTNSSASSYKSYKNNMQLYFGELTGGKKYEPYTNAEADTYNVVNTLTSTVKNVNSFYSSTYEAGAVTDITPYEFFQNTLCHFVSDVATAGQYASAITIIGSIKVSSSKLYKSIINYFLDEEILDKHFTMAHQAETYCAYMMSMTESQVKTSRQAYKNTVNCPVDVTVIDNETGEVVGKIVNNVIDEEIAAKENSVVMTVDGDSKSFWLPSDGDYEVILTGNDNGTMDYTVSEVDSDAGETERVNFYDVEIKDGKSYTGEIIADDFVIDEYTITSENGKVISPDETLDDSSMQTVEINVSVSGNGYVTDSMTVTKGDYVTLEATAEDGYYFDGWYEDGNLISYEETYSFVAKENREIVAEFIEVSEYEPEIFCYITSINYKDSSWLSLENFPDILGDSDYTAEFESSDEGVIYVDDDGRILATGTGTATVTCTVTYENGYIQVFEIEIDVTYTWWQWLIVIFLFGWIWY